MSRLRKYPQEADQAGFVSRLSPRVRSRMLLLIWASTQNRCASVCVRLRPIAAD
jgi:hypothetical protein